MTRAEMDRIVQQHFEHEAKDDVEGVLATFTDDVRHQCVGSPWGPLAGKAAARPFYEQLFRDLRGEGVRPVSRWYGDGFMVDETEWTGEIRDASFCGLPGRSGHATFRLLHVLEFRDGLISREYIWFDVAEIAAQVGWPAGRSRDRPGGPGDLRA